MGTNETFRAFKIVDKTLKVEDNTAKLGRKLQNCELKVLKFETNETTYRKEKTN